MHVCCVLWNIQQVKKISLCNLLQFLVISRKIGYEDYSHDIFSVKGFPLQDQIESICCNGIILDIVNT